MPRLAKLDGVLLYIHFGDHPPPHVHVRGGDLNATMTIGDADVLAGDLPADQAKLVAKWIRTNRVGLTRAWNLASTGQSIPSDVLEQHQREGAP